MPIRSDLRHLYGREWRRISHAAIVRAGFRCQGCGVPNYALLRREGCGPALILSPDQAEAARRDGHGVVKVVLTVAHLDHDPRNNEPENLAAFCQRCHLHHDRRQHASNARETRRARKDLTRPLLAPPLPAQASSSSPVRSRRPRQAHGSLKRVQNVSGAVWYGYWNDAGVRKGKRLGLCDQMTRRQAEEALAAIVAPINARNGREHV